MIKGRINFAYAMSICFERALGENKSIIDDILEEFSERIIQSTEKDLDYARKIAGADVIGFKIIETSCMGAHTGWAFDFIYYGNESNIVGPNFDSIRCPGRLAEFLTPAMIKYLKKKGYKVGTIDDSQSDMNGCMIIYSEN